MSTAREQQDPAVAWYRGEQGRVYHTDKRGLDRPGLDWVMGLRARKFQRHVPPDSVVCELGAGAGWNLGRLKCARRIGVEASEFLAGDLAALGIEYFATMSHLPEATADVMICHHALEHLLEPAAALKDMARVLKPGGRLLVHVPWERERRYARYHAGEPNHHLFTWNAQTLGNLASVLGFSIESLTVQRYGYDRFAAKAAARLLMGETGFRAIRAGLIALRPLREVALIARR